MMKQLERKQKAQRGYIGLFSTYAQIRRLECPALTWAYLNISHTTIGAMAQWRLTDKSAIMN
jgi:hypothetical protein